MLEYALVARLIVIAAVVVIGSVGTKVLARWNSVNSGSVAQPDETHRSAAMTLYHAFVLLPLFVLLSWAAVHDVRTRRIRTGVFRQLPTVMSPYGSANPSSAVA